MLKIVRNNESEQSNDENDDKELVIQEGIVDSDDASDENEESENVSNVQINKSESHSESQESSSSEEDDKDIIDVEESEEQRKSEESSSESEEDIKDDKPINIMPVNTPFASIEMSPSRILVNYSNKTPNIINAEESVHQLNTPSEDNLNSSVKVSSNRQIHVEEVEIENEPIVYESSPKNQESLKEPSVIVDEENKEEVKDELQEESEEKSPIKSSHNDKDSENSELSNSEQQSISNKSDASNSQIPSSAIKSVDMEESK